METCKTKYEMSVRGVVKRAYSNDMCAQRVVTRTQNNDMSPSVVTIIIIRCYELRIMIYM